MNNRSQLNAEASERLQMQKTAQMLYNEVKAYFEKTTVEDLTAKLESVNEKIKENPDYYLTTDEFSMLGFITYLVGVDMVSSREHVLHNVAENYRSRFVDNKLADDKFISALMILLANVSTKNFENAKEELKTILMKEIPGDRNQIGQLRIAIRNSLKHSLLSRQHIRC